MSDITLKLTTDELFAVAYALFHQVIREVKWCVRPDEWGWDQSGWRFQQESTNDLVQAYTKTLLELRDLDGLTPELLSTVTLSEPMWDLIDQMANAQSQEDLPTHGRHDHDECLVCWAFLLV